MSRKPFIAGNWKMNMTAESGTQLIKELIPLVKDANCDVCLCVPAILIPAMTKASAGTNIHIGAENVHWANSGAYTGEIRYHRSQRKTPVLRRNRRNGK